MRCPFCQADNDRVLDSRTTADGYSIRRRRECLECKRRYTTYERLEELTIKVIKKDNVREPFNREKIRQGILKACWKRPISDEIVDTMIAEIESDIYADFESEIESRVVGGMVMHQLSKVDQVAYVRFASVYRDFSEARDFEEFASTVQEAADGRRAE